MTDAPPTSATPRRVLITGAAGRIGQALRDGLRGRYGALRLTDAVDPGAARDGEEIILADLTEIGGLMEAMRDVDAVVHLGALADEADYEAIRRVNLDGTFHVFEAARVMGVRRVVFASSIHAVGFYPRGERIGPDVPTRPDSLYGVSKVFGEAVGRLYADKYGLEVACVRICSFQERPRDRRHLSTWLSPRDAVQLTQRCLEAPELGFRIVAGISRNTRAWMTPEGWAEIGYEPQDDAEQYARDVEHIHGPEDDITEQLQGGVFVAPDYRGAAAREE